MGLTYRINDVVYSRSAGTTKSGCLLSLRPQELQIFDLLCRRWPLLATHKQVERVVRGGDEKGGSENDVHAAMYRLRERVGHDVVVNLRGRGWTLGGSVEIEGSTCLLTWFALGYRAVRRPMSGVVGVPYADQIVRFAVIYGVLEVATALAETGDQFRTFGPRICRVAPYIFAWAYLSSWFVMSTTARRILDGRRHTLVWAVAGYVISTGVLFAAMTLILPAAPLLDLDFTPFGAQIGFLKTGVCYPLFLAVQFQIFPLCFAVLAHREVVEHHRRQAKALLAGESPSDAPRALRVPSEFLWFLWWVIFLISSLLSFRMVEHLHPNPGNNAFTALLLVRDVLWFVAALSQTVWYTKTIERLCTDMGVGKSVAWPSLIPAGFRPSDMSSKSRPIDVKHEGRRAG